MNTPTDRRKSSCHAPYGWRVNPDNPKRWIPCSVEKWIVARIGELYATGISFDKVCYQLAKEGYEPRGAKWDRKTIQRIVKQNGFTREGEE